VYIWGRCSFNFNPESVVGPNRFEVPAQILRFDRFHVESPVGILIDNGIDGAGFHFPYLLLVRSFPLTADIFRNNSVFYETD